MKNEPEISRFAVVNLTVHTHLCELEVRVAEEKARDKVPSMKEQLHKVSILP